MELPQLIILGVLLLMAVTWLQRFIFCTDPQRRSQKRSMTYGRRIPTRSFQFPPGTRICGGLLRISISSSVCSAKSAGAVSRGTWN